MKVAIVGAGIAGLACAESLREGGADVVVFDKGRRPGGRLSTLRLDHGTWDFGAQFVAPGSAAFAAKLAAWVEAGVLAQWPGGPPDALVGVPAMASLIEIEAARLPVQFSVQVQSLQRGSQGWSLLCIGAVHGPFDAAVLAIPAEQAAPLLSLHDLTLAREAAAIRSHPCWTVMAAFDAPLRGLADVVQCAGPIAWAARNNSKPGRPPRECWVLQADAAWSQQHLEAEADWVANELLRRFCAETGLTDGLQPTFLKAHRWRFALPHAGHGVPHWNGNLKLGACGDWCAAPHIAGAWQSGAELAEQILRPAQSARAEQLHSFSRAK